MYTWFPLRGTTQSAHRVATATFGVHSIMMEKSDQPEPEPVFVDRLWSPGINSQPCGPVRQPYFAYRPARLHKLAEPIPRNWFLSSINVYKYELWWGWEVQGCTPGRMYSWRGPSGWTWDHLWLMFCCIRLKVLMQGFLHFLWWNFCSESDSSSHTAFYHKWNPASSGQHRVENKTR